MPSTTVSPPPVPRWLEANGRAMRYCLTDPPGRTIVLIHEMGGSLDSWRHVFALLPRAWRVLTYDLRGAGMSEKIVGTVTLDDFADDLLGLVAALGLTTPVAVAGVAVGGAIAIRFAARYPQMISALVAISPACGVPHEQRAAALENADRLEREGGRATTRSTALAADSPIYPAELRDKHGTYEEFRIFSLTNDPRSLAATRRMLAELEMESDFATVRCPALIIGGTLDSLRPIEIVEPIASKIEGARFLELRTGHFAPLQTPKLVADALIEFFGEH